MELTDKIRENAGKYDEVIDGLFTELLDSNTADDSAIVMNQIDAVLGVMRYKLPKEEYNVYEHIYEATLRRYLIKQADRLYNNGN